jgi:voltage-gated potassium channel
MGNGRDEELITGWRGKLYTVIFEADTPAGKLFDVLLIVAIILSVIAVMLDSVAGVGVGFGSWLYGLEWLFTVLFTVEYMLRMICIGRPLRYAFSFYGIVDFLSFMPTYVSLLVPGSEYLLVIRVIRILRLFRVLKLVKYIAEASVLWHALKASRHKIVVFLFAVLTLVVVFGSLMYLIEGEENGFTSIPRSVYWAIVTMTTVGYGDISPKTDIGQMIAAVIMVIGYAIIAVPTGIVTSELAFAARRRIDSRVCPSCSTEGHVVDATFCRDCGEKL